jgi:hypothetical protein
MAAQARPRENDVALPSLPDPSRRAYNGAMLSEAKIEAYRRMTPEERWREVDELMTLAWRALLELPEEERQRRLAIIREEHEISDRILLERLRELG